MTRPDLRQRGWTWCGGGSRRFRSGLQSSRSQSLHVEKPRYGHYSNFCFVYFCLKILCAPENIDSRSLMCIHSCVFNSTHTLLGDKLPTFYQKLVYITTQATPFYERPGLNTEHTNSLLLWQWHYCFEVTREGLRPGWKDKRIQWKCSLFLIRLPSLVFKTQKCRPIKCFLPQSVNPPENILLT